MSIQPSIDARRLRAWRHHVPNYLYLIDHHRRGGHAASSAERRSRMMLARAEATEGSVYSALQPQDRPRDELSASFQAHFNGGRGWPSIPVARNAGSLGIALSSPEGSPARSPV